MIETVGSFSWDFPLLNLKVTCLSFGLRYRLFIASNCIYILLIMIFFTINLCSIILNLCVHTYDRILFPKCLLCIYVLPGDGLRRPKYVIEIIITKQIFMHEYLPLVGINSV